MDWLKGMNGVVRHIEENLCETIAYDTLSRIVGCSVYEFFRIFSFMTGMSLAEYIRRRRLSQAVFDIKNGDDRIIDIALKYGYESPTSFAKAFRELHGTTPSAARKSGAVLKTYPPLSFKLIIQGVNEMEFRIEKREGFFITGRTMTAAVEDMEHFKLPSMWSVKPEKSSNFSFINLDKAEPGTYEQDAPDGGKITIKLGGNGNASFTFTDKDGKVTETVLEKNGESAAKIIHIGGEGKKSGIDFTYGIAAFDFTVKDGKVSVTVGSEVGSEAEVDAPCCGCEPEKRRAIPAAQWAVFSFREKLTPETAAGAYTRILTEWFPASGYKRDETVPHLERIPAGTGAENHPWEIWLPVTAK
jgi:AraC-like DNA-binding protein/predicted transcriptional regulator YdeE